MLLKNNEFLTVMELSELLKVKQVRIYRWAFDGLLPGIKIGATWRFRRKTMESWAKQNKQLLKE